MIQKFLQTLFDIIIPKSHRVTKSIETYRKTLLSAIATEKEVSVIKMYNDHLLNLDKIELAYKKKDIELLRALFEDETRYFGWTYLPNNIGDNAEKAFYHLKKTAIESN